VPGTFRYELQKDVAGGPKFLSTVRAKLTALQSTPFCNCGDVGSAETAEMLRTPATAMNDERRMTKGPDGSVRNYGAVTMRRAIERCFCSDKHIYTQSSQNLSCIAILPMLSELNILSQRRYGRSS
jgi:hypothetical protein